MSEFDKWNELKKEIDKREKILKFRERDIWFLNIGKNIGYEQNGKGEEFLRPVVVLRKFSNRYFLAIFTVPRFFLGGDLGLYVMKKYKMSKKKRKNAFQNQ